MPTVTTKTVVKVKAQATTVNLIKQDELARLAELQASITEYEELLKPIKKEMEKLELSVLVAATGFKKKEEWSPLSPDSLSELINKRIAKGLVKTEGGKLDWNPSTNEPNGRCTPKWKEAYTALAGEDKAKELQENTKPSFSYHVSVTEK